MADRPIRWGILSTGGIAEKFTEDLRLVPDAEVLAVGSRSLEAARKFADRYAIPRAYGSWRELADDTDVDVVYVATPHQAHHPAALLCLEAGRAVLCEKPMTLDAASSAHLIEAARERGVFLMEAMWTRCMPAVRRLVELVADGAIGDVTVVHAEFGLGGPFAPEHRLRNPTLGGGALLDLGIYPVTLAHLVLGAPAEVRAWARLGPEGTDENTALILGYESGAVASLTCGIVGATSNRATVTGTTGRIELPRSFHHPRQLTVYRPDAEPEVVDAGFEGEGYQFEAIEVQRCLRAGLTESPLVPWATTLEVMSILDTARTQIGVTYPA
ncbi:MAG TPA: Gfo/Idh/MocA family oxidoreductase [Micromonosporaceae bacterium]|nr:Gfo/Idh/MocA family oxidoreductase [Micromonosporaceae bacterium]